MSNRYLKLLEELKKNPMEPLSRNSRVLIVDGLNTFIRSYAASPVTNDDGLHVGGISGTLLSIGHAIKVVNPTRVVVVFDGKGGTRKRKEIYPEYKAGRKFQIRLNRSMDLEEGEESQKRQLLRLVEYLETLPVDIITVEGIEADDTIAYLVKEAFKETSCIMSTDKDFYQLVSENTQIWSPTKKRLIYTQDIKDQYNISPQNFLLYRAAEGDASDNIPGIKGIGLKTLVKLFPELIEDAEMSLDDFLEKASKDDKNKKLKLIADSRQVMERNIQLMKLHPDFIQNSAKFSILEQLDNSNRLSKMQFNKMLYEDRMSGAIRNADLWLREVMFPIDKYNL